MDMRDSHPAEKLDRTCVTGYDARRLGLTKRAADFAENGLKGNEQP